jgi:hypothetical protein
MKTKNSGLINFATCCAGGDAEARTKVRVMALLVKVRLLCLAGLLSIVTASASADVEVSASVQIHAKADFYTPLTPYGGWVEVGSYGRCWHPAHLAVEWRPYCYGHWVWTDCGWYWESDEPWGWACYHYGYWVNDPAYGWLWVPEVEWAPAWVSWRVGGGYIGWAPMPPPGIIFVSHPEPALFVFVNTEHFADPVRPSAVIVNNVAIAKKTTEITQIKRETRTLSGGAPQRVVMNRGPSVEMVQKATGKSFEATPVREVVKHTTLPSPVSKSSPVPATGMHAPGAQEQPRGSYPHSGTPDGKGEHGPRGGDDRGRDRDHDHGHGHGS